MEAQSKNYSHILPLLVDFRQAGELTTFSPSTLLQWYRGTKSAPVGFPRPVRIGERVLRYRTADLIAWVDSLGGPEIEGRESSSAALVETPPRPRPGRPRTSATGAIRKKNWGNGGGAL